MPCDELEAELMYIGIVMADIGGGDAQESSVLPISTAGTAGADGQSAEAWPGCSPIGRTGAWPPKPVGNNRQHWK